MRSQDLQNIYHMLVDSQKGYAEAAGVADSPQIIEFFTSRARDRGELVTRFAQIIPTSAEDRQEGTTSGAAHRLFLNLRSLLQDNTKAALAEVERGETAFLEAIENALDDNELVGDERLLLSDLRDEVRADRSAFTEMQALI